MVRLAMACVVVGGFGRAACGQDAEIGGGGVGTGEAEVGVVLGEGEAEGPTPGDASAFPVVRVFAKGGVERRFDTDIDGGGEVAITRAGGGVDVDMALSRKVQLSFGVDHVVSEFDFDDPDAFTPGVGGRDPFDTLHETSLSFGGRYAIDETWGVFGSVGLRAGYEDSADFGESLTVSGLGGVSYTVDETLTLGLGTIVSSRLEDSASVVPVIGIDWRFAEGWRLSSLGGPGRPADRAALTGGVSLELSYEQSDLATWFVRGVYDTSAYRLDGGNDVAPGGLFRQERFDVTGGVDLTLADGLDVRLFGGAAVYQELEFEDDSGSDVVDEETDPQPFIGALLVWRF